MPTVDLASWKSQHLAGLRKVSSTAEIEINALLVHVLNKNTAWIFSHPETHLTAEQTALLENAISRLYAGEPLAYITRKQEFYGLEFLVDSRVLIPRPETELLVEHAITWLNTHPAKKLAADIGTGSGAIAVTLAKSCSELEVTAIDISEEALEVAKENARKHKVERRIEFVHANLLQGNTKYFDLILANLPYIPTATLKELDALRYEPLTALDGGHDGMDFIKQLMAQLPNSLAPGGSAIFEIQYNQGYKVREIARQQFPEALISIQHDLASLPRIVVINT